MIRGACGSDEHPDPILFIQVYRLLSFYSLVKPPEGSNVEGVEIFEMLLNRHGMTDAEAEENKNEWEEVLDTIIARGPNSAEIHRAGDEHDYNVHEINEVVQVMNYFTLLRLGEGGKKGGGEYSYRTPHVNEVSVNFFKIMK